MIQLKLYDIQQYNQYMSIYVYMQSKQLQNKTIQSQDNLTEDRNSCCYLYFTQPFSRCLKFLDQYLECSKLTLMPKKNQASSQSQIDLYDLEYTKIYSRRQLPKKMHNDMPMIQDDKAPIYRYAQIYDLSFQQRQKYFGYTFQQILKRKQDQEQKMSKTFFQQLKIFICCQDIEKTQNIQSLYRLSSVSMVQSQHQIKDLPAMMLSQQNQEDNMENNNKKKNYKIPAEVEFNQDLNFDIYSSESYKSQQNVDMGQVNKCKKNARKNIHLRNKDADDLESIHSEIINISENEEEQVKQMNDAEKEIENQQQSESSNIVAEKNNSSRSKQQNQQQQTQQQLSTVSQTNIIKVIALDTGIKDNSSLQSQQKTSDGQGIQIDREQKQVENDKINSKEVTAKQENKINTNILRKNIQTNEEDDQEIQQVNWSVPNKNAIQLKEKFQRKRKRRTRKAENRGQREEFYVDEQQLQYKDLRPIQKHIKTIQKQSPLIFEEQIILQNTKSKKADKLKSTPEIEKKYNQNKVNVSINMLGKKKRALVINLSEQVDDDFDFIDAQDITNAKNINSADNPFNKTQRLANNKRKKMKWRQNKVQQKNQMHQEQILVEGLNLPAFDFQQNDDNQSNNKSDETPSYQTKLSDDQKQL